MKKLLKILKQFFKTLINEGPIALIKKVRRYIYDKIRRTLLPELFGPNVTATINSLDHEKHFTDVTIIYTGRDFFEGYRAYQLLDTLVANNITAKIVKTSQVTFEEEAFSNCFLLVKVDRTPFWEEFISRAKENNKKIYTSDWNDSDDNSLSLSELVDGNIGITGDLESLIFLDSEVVQYFNEYRPKTPKKWNAALIEVSIDHIPSEKIEFKEFDLKSDIESFFNVDILFIKEDIFENLSKFQKEIINLMFRERLFVIKSSNEIADIVENKLDSYRIVEKTTLNQGNELVDLIRKSISKTAAIILPSTGLSGGNIVSLKHISIIKQQGYIITVFNSMSDINDKNDLSWSDSRITSIPLVKRNGSYFKKAIATFWITVETLDSYIQCDEKYYLVQSFEPDFYPKNDINRVKASATYKRDDLHYVTISTWCREWLSSEFGRKVKYVPNGIDIKKFSFRERDFTGRLNLLIEGNCDDEFKNVDLSFKIANKLDKNKFHITYLSYGSKVKDWYEYDELLFKVPFNKVHEVYQNSHILLKTSTLESFSYPPLEMMSTGGIVFVLRNQGNKEFIEDRHNGILISDNIDETIQKINSVISDTQLLDKLIKNGLETAQLRSWDNVGENVNDAYDL